MPNTPVHATAEGLPEYHNPSLFLEMTPALRQRMEHAVEQLIWLLDVFDGDTDFEPDMEGEPSLGWPDGVSQGAARCGGGYDLELDLADDEDGGDDEPDVDDEPSIGVSYYVGYGVFECDLEQDLCDDESDNRDLPFA